MLGTGSFPFPRLPHSFLVYLLAIRCSVVCTFSSDLWQIFVTRLHPWADLVLPRHLCPDCGPVSVPFHPHFYYISVRKSRSRRAAHSVRRNVPAVHSLHAVR